MEYNTDISSTSKKPLIISPNNSYTQQKITMDPCPLNENEKIIYHIIGYSEWDSIKVYNSFEHFKMQNYNEYKIPIKGYGSNWTIFKNCLYFCSEWYGKNIVKLNLKTNKKEKEKTLNDNKGDAGQWGGYNCIIFISNPESIYIVYQSSSINKLVIRELNPDSLEIINSWETNAKEKNKYGSFFMIGKTLYAINSYNESPTKIIYKYDLNNKRDYDINIDFENIGTYDTSLHYCYMTRQLWTVNDGKFYSYDINFS